MGKIKAFFANKWVKFTLVSLLYILWFVVWTGNLWMLLGEVIIYDIYISKYIYKFFWEKHKKRKSTNKTYKVWAEWVEAIIFATVAATVIRIFIFEMFVIPTPSMEKSLLVGDYLCVSKVAYGPKMPNTPISFPFVHNTMPFSKTKKSYSEWITWPYHRLVGWGTVKRGDVVVFNFPAGDTVALENPEYTYYDIVNSYVQRYGERQGREIMNKEFTIAARPVDKRDNYVKRCVGVPGDSIHIIHSQLMVNGKPFDNLPAMQYTYKVITNGAYITKKEFRDMGIAPSDIGFDPEEKSYMLPLTEKNRARIAAMPNVVSVEKEEDQYVLSIIFPHSENYQWNEDNFGPLWVPAKGTTVQLTTENLPLYQRIIDIYEENDLRVEGNVIYINGKAATSYTFKMDYYFMMGDNRHNSADSRYWGFVPEDHIVGKPSFVWFSVDKEESFPKNIRWSRMFRGTGALQNR